ncbi:MAG: DUF4214 domain-containing protein [Cyanobacteria bacterium]|nr:DUF4214 domain-containing protein [Cyanobacteriota bacterium]
MKNNFLRSLIMKPSIIKSLIIFILVILISLSLLPQFLYADSNSSNSAVNDFVTRFYKICLDRMPDPEGLQSWTNGLITGSITGADVANGFIFSNELMSKNLSDEDFLTILYRAFFNRQPDAAGYNSWLNLLRNGASRHYVLAGFINSIEFKALCDSYGINAGSSDSSGSPGSSNYYSSNNPPSSDSVVEAFNTENNLLGIINQTRAKNGRRQLVINAELSSIARARSMDMLTRNYFSHITPDGKNIFMILNENGYSWQLAGENIFECSPAANGTETAIFNIWMSSSSHRDNILNGNFSQVGIGIIDISGIRTATMVFSN